MRLEREREGQEREPPEEAGREKEGACQEEGKESSFPELQSQR